MWQLGNDKEDAEIKGKLVSTNEASYKLHGPIYRHNGNNWAAENLKRHWTPFVQGRSSVWRRVVVISFNI